MWISNTQGQIQIHTVGGEEIKRYRVKIKQILVQKLRQGSTRQFKFFLLSNHLALWWESERKKLISTYYHGFVGVLVAQAFDL